MLFLKQSTAITLKIGPFLDDGDGKTAETALTISQADVRLSKNGGNIAQKNQSSNCTHDELGYYDCSLDATDTGTVGRLQLAVHESGALPVWHDFMVLPANAYDSLISGSDYLQADAVQVEGSDATDQINAACDTALSDYDPPTKAELDSGLAALNDLSAAQVNAEVDTALADYDPPTKAELDSGLAGLNDPTAAAIRAEMDTNSTQLAAIVADTTEIGAAGAGLSSIPWNASWDAEVQSEVTDALNAYDPPTKAELDSGLAALNDPTTAAIRAEIDANSTQLAAIVADTGELQTDDIPGLIAALPTAAENADAIWDEALSGHSTNGTAGKQLTDVALSDELPVSPPSAASIRAEIDANSTQLAAIVADTAALNDSALPDSVPSDGSIPTLKQAVYMIAQFLTERSVSGTTVTVKKVDGSTSLLTLTLDSDSTPTSITRTT